MFITNLTLELIRSWFPERSAKSYSARYSTFAIAALVAYFLTATKIAAVRIFPLKNKHFSQNLDNDGRARNWREEGKRTENSS